jgi:hypothetical protein
LFGPRVFWLFELSLSLAPVWSGFKVKENYTCRLQKIIQ